jgi:hypothetical protein
LPVRCESDVMTQTGWSGYELAPIDRLMNRRLAASVWAVVGAVSSVALWLIYARSPLELIRDPKAFRAWVPLVGFCASVFAIGGWWTVFTWRRIWRRGRSDRERVLYNYGVRGFGVFGSVGITLFITWLGWTADSADSHKFLGPLTTGGFLAGIFFGIPLSLQMGYFWGVLFAAFLGAESDSRAEQGEPPKIS